MSEVVKPIFLDETGQDILTALQQIASRTAGFAGPGVPAGGSAGQILVKKSGTNYDTEWANGGTSDVFFATYNVTTSAEIAAAYNAGKAVYVIDGENTAPLFEIYPNDDYAFFGTTNGIQTYGWECDTDRWSRVIRTIGTYSKPAGGIPASDLASGVIPTVPDAATSTPLMDGTAAVGSSTKYAKEDHVHPSDASRMTAAQVNAAINQSLQTLSPEDIGAAPAVEVVVITDDGAVALALNPGVIYEFSGTLTSLTITLVAASAPAYYHFRFNSGSTAVSLALPQTVTMPSGFQVEASKHYEIDILDGYGIAQSW